MSFINLFFAIFWRPEKAMLMLHFDWLKFQFLKKSNVFFYFKKWKLLSALAIKNVLIYTEIHLESAQSI